MNRVNLIGRLTKDPELRFTPGTGIYEPRRKMIKAMITNKRR